MLSLGKASCGVALPNLRCMLGFLLLLLLFFFFVFFSVSMVHGILPWTTGSLSRVQMLMDAIALGSVRTPEESALKVDSGRKIPCRTGESNLRQRRAGPTLYQLSYIPTSLPAVFEQILH